MKILALSVLALGFSSVTFAAAPSADSVLISRLLINNQPIVDQLKKNGIDALRDLTSAEVKPGITRYVMRFERNCFCIPAQANVTIQEDMTPTYRDGAPEYESSLEIKEGN